MNRKEIIETLVSKYGTMNALRYYLKEARSSISNIKVGIADNNFPLATKDVEKLNDCLANIETMLGEERVKNELTHKDLQTK